MSVVTEKKKDLSGASPLSAPRAQVVDLLPKKLVHSRPLLDPQILKRATIDSFRKLNPVVLAKNPVIFVVEVGALVTTLLLIHDLSTGIPGTGFSLQIS